jgi:FHS family L-fucose permease-like MFS transporter
MVYIVLRADIVVKETLPECYLFSSLGIVALVIGMGTSGMVSVYAITSVGLFCSTLWPCIFTLAVSGLEAY